ncbi:hypothetical protein PHPALM_30408 [Phytophthora palmivora]|uniref:Uncharacterized protein n=1 Tax=Phytophthora palmivora TaxID=4796 RepID=A0A2P4X582_9STRA|nr:hypothetical protein PHPALM_30408 [Phytophthora palmivora]
MCNSIKMCFSIIKAKMKRYLVLHKGEMQDDPFRHTQEQRMQHLVTT